MQRILHLLLAALCIFFSIDFERAFAKQLKVSSKDSRLRKSRHHRSDSPRFDHRGQKTQSSSDLEGDSSGEYDDDEDDTDEKDTDEDDRDNGPWRVSVPREYQKKTYSLRIGSKWQPLSTDEILLTPRELPQYVALFDSYGRVEQRKRTMINQHLLTGFRPRRFRISAFIGGGSIQGDHVDTYELTGDQVQLGVDGYYQPGAFGLLLGLEKISAPGNDYILMSDFIKLGGTFETGLFYRGAHYRWHQLFQGGLAVGSLTVREKAQSNDKEKKDIETDSIASGSVIGPFASMDSIYMFQNWWWGGRFSINYFQAKSRVEEQKDETAKTKNQLPKDDTPNITKTLTTMGIALVGSFTW
jgi:hypothetical protein